MTRDAWIPVSSNVGHPSALPGHLEEGGRPPSEVVRRAPELRAIVGSSFAEGRTVTAAVTDTLKRSGLPS